MFLEGFVLIADARARRQLSSSFPLHQLMIHLIRFEANHGCRGEEATVLPEIWQHGLERRRVAATGQEGAATIRPPAKREQLRSQAKSRELLPKVLRTSVVTPRTSTWRSSETSD